MDAPAVQSWISPKVQHAYGLPEVKPNKKGSLAISPSGITFTADKGASYQVPRAALLAVNSGNERVELWGTGGRILRMAIPNGGGLAAGGVLHHKVNMLSIEFKDMKQAYHAAVFYLPASEAERVIASFSEVPASPKGLVAESLPKVMTFCGPDSSVSPRSVLLTMPAWNETNVPSSYRDLVYEHAIDRLKKIKEVGRIYRDGEIYDQQNCPQYTIHLSVTAFKQGSQVARSMIGPVGFFVGTTNMAFTMDITDATGQLKVSDQLKSTVRGDGESKNVADGVAKTLAKRYASETKKFEKVQAAPARPAVRS